MREFEIKKVLPGGLVVELKESFLLFLERSTAALLAKYTSVRVLFYDQNYKKYRIV